MNEDLMRENAELRRQLDLVTEALEAASEALTYLGGTLHAERCRHALAAVRKPAGSPAGEGGEA